MTTFVVMSGDGPVARAVLTGTTQCPSITLGNAAQPMRVRLAPDALPAFPILVCETVIPAGTTSAGIAGQQLPLPGQTVHTVAGIGDTGCRLKKGWDTAGTGATRSHSDHDDDKGKFQDCDKPEQWPFAELARSVALANPDLVVHVGDYIYREAPCPPNDKACGGSPYGDNWMTWQADFFVPAAPLLKAAPWIAVRGNHEICARAGQGYLVFLDARPATNGSLPPCVEIFPNYSVTVGGRVFVVIDTTDADDVCKEPSACNTKDYVATFAGMSPPTNSWLVTHKPIWAVRKGHKNPKIVTAALQGALADGKLPAGISLTLAGHIHFWQTLSFKDQRPPQFVLGNGGTLLAGKVKEPLVGLKIGGTSVTYGKIHDEWGYTLFTPTGEAWKATFYSPKGDKKFDCKIESGKVRCQNPPR